MLIINWVQALSILALTSLAIAGWSTAARRLFRTDLALSLPLGLGSMLTISLIVGLIPRGFTLFSQGLIVIIGWALLAQSGLKAKRIEFKKPELRTEHLWLVFPGLYFLARFFSCGIPQQHSDPLYYHLAAPRLWSQLGQIKLVDTHPTYAQAGFWENLYGIPQLLLGTNGMSAHVTTHVFAQWMHMFWGQVACVLLGATVIAKLAPSTARQFTLRVFVAWLAVCLTETEWLGCLAKNDYVLTFFALGAALAFLDRRYFLCALLAGFSYSTKTLGVVSCLALPPAIILQILLSHPRNEAAKRIARAAGYYTLGIIAGTLPFLMRNIIWMRNPVFPYLDEVIGPFWLTRFWIGHLHAGGGDVRLNSAMILWTWNRLFAKVHPQVLVVLGTLGFVWLSAKRRLASTVVPALALAAGQMGVVMLMMRPASDGRYGIQAGVFAVLTAGALFLEAIQNMQLPASLLRPASAGLLALGLFINVPLDAVFKITKNYLFAPREKYIDQFHWTFDSKRWLHDNTPADAVILFTSDKMNFYLDRDFETMPEMRRWEDRMLTYKSPQDFFADVRARGYRYLHFNIESIYPPMLAPYWNELLAMKDRAAFASSTSLIFDVTDPRLYK